MVGAGAGGVGGLRVCEWLHNINSNNNNYNNYNNNINNNNINNDNDNDNDNDDNNDSSSSSSMIPRYLITAPERPPSRCNYILITYSLHTNYILISY